MRYIQFIDTLMNKRQNIIGQNRFNSDCNKKIIYLIYKNGLEKKFTESSLFFAHLRTLRLCATPAERKKELKRMSSIKVLSRGEYLEYKEHLVNKEQEKTQYNDYRTYNNYSDNRNLSISAVVPKTLPKNVKGSVIDAKEIKYLN